MIDGECVDLIRLEDEVDGTFGIILVNGLVCCVSLELRWKSNMAGISCIPEGEYWCKKRESWFNSDRYGYTYEVQDVEDRSAILFHPANLYSELKGCIAPGSHFGELSGKRGVLASGNAFKRFKQMIGDIEQIKLRAFKMIMSTRGCYHKGGTV